MTATVHVRQLPNWGCGKYPEELSTKPPAYTAHKWSYTALSPRREFTGHNAKHGRLKYRVIRRGKHHVKDTELHNESTCAGDRQHRAVKRLRRFVRRQQRQWRQRACTQFPRPLRRSGRRPEKKMALGYQNHYQFPVSGKRAGFCVGSFERD